MMSGFKKVLLGFFFTFLVCASASKASWHPSVGGSHSAPDVGGIQPYFESLGKDVNTYRTIFTSILPPEEAAYLQLQYNEFLQPAAIPVAYPAVSYDSQPSINIFPNMSAPECIGCQFVLTTLRTLVGGLKPRSYEELRPVLMPFCEMLMKGRPSKEICPGVLDNYGPLVVEIVQKKNPNQSTLDSCVFLNQCPPPEFDDHEDGLEEVYLPNHYLPEPPIFTGYDIFRHEQPEEEQRSRGRRSAGVFRVVQLADVHFDDEYAPGSVSECSFHVCCRSNYNGTGSAHPIGEYSCNLPPSTVQMFLDKIAELKPDLILQTGDTPPHHLWYEDPERQIAATKWLANELKTRMYKVAPVIPSIGNHDVFPSNMFYMKRNATQDTIKALIEGYPILSDNPELQETFMKGGYFEYEVKEGLRVLVYNSNYGYTDNWYNLLSHYEEADYLDMRHFIERRLAAARREKCKVLFVTHHPVGDGIITFDDWVSELAIEFNDVIVLHTSGHHHTDEFSLFTRPGDRWASAVMFAAPSSNTYSSINPSLRVYELDARNFHLKDYKQYHLDIAKAQKLATARATETTQPTGSPTEEATSEPDIKTSASPEINTTPEISTTEKTETMTTEKPEPVPEPEIELIYSAKEEYGMHDLSPAAWHDLAARMMKNITTLHKYQYNFGTRVVGKRDRPSDLCAEEDGKCKTEVVCDVMTSTLLDYMRCVRDGVKLPEGEVPTEEPDMDSAGTSAQSSILAALLVIVICYYIMYFQN